MGRAEEEKGLAEDRAKPKKTGLAEDVGRAEEDKGPAEEDVDRTNEDVGRTDKDVGQAKEDVGQAEEVILHKVGENVKMGNKSWREFTSIFSARFGRSSL